MSGWVRTVKRLSKKKEGKKKKKPSHRHQDADCQRERGWEELEESKEGIVVMKGNSTLHGERTIQYAGDML